MSKRKKIDPNAIDFNEFMEEMKKETDRGAILFGATFLDELLKELLKKSLVQSNNKLLENVFDFSNPFGTFSSRINFAFLLGLLSKSEYDDLHILRNIRNDFAHLLLMNLSIENDPSIKDRVKNIDISEKILNLFKNKKVSTRTRIHIAIYQLASSIKLRQLSSKPFEERPEKKIIKEFGFNE